MTGSAMARSASALVADVGGTWVRFAVAERVPGSPPTLARPCQLAVADFPSLVAAARHYLDALAHPGIRPATAVFAVAGRVESDRAEMTNHPWRIDAAECANALALSRVGLLNDFTAQAMAVPHLGASDRIALGDTQASASAEDAQTFAVLGPGTGLGVSALVRRAGLELALESEGGHAAFAPKTARQRAVLELLSTRFQRVSYERLLSGGGLSNLHWALSRVAGSGAAEDLPPEQVTRDARAGDPLAIETLELFCEVFGAFAGDLVLTFGGWDGVYLSGGLVPLLLEDLQRGGFRRAFENKGRFSQAMTRVPVFGVLHPQPGLLGAAAAALRNPPPSDTGHTNAVWSGGSG